MPRVAGVGKVLHERPEGDVHEPARRSAGEHVIHYLNEQERTALITKPPSKSVQESSWPSSTTDRAKMQVGDRYVSAGEPAPLPGRDLERRTPPKEPTAWLSHLREDRAIDHLSPRLGNARAGEPSASRGVVQSVDGGWVAAPISHPSHLFRLGGAGA